MSHLVGVTFGECYIRWVLHLVDVALVGVTFGGCCEIHKLLSDSKVGLKTAYPTVQHNGQSKKGQRLNTSECLYSTVQCVMGH